MEKEFSFKNYFLYLVRKWLIIAICVVIGAVGGIIYAFCFSDDTKYEVYETTLRLDLNKYIEMNGGDISNLSEGSAKIFSDNASELIGIALEGTIKTATFNAVKDSIFTKKVNESMTLDFYRNLVVTKKDHSVTVGYVSQCKNDSDRDKAKQVVTKYIEIATAQMEKIEPLIKENNAILVGEILLNDDIENSDYSKIVPTNQVGVITVVLLGAVLGAVLGVAIATVIDIFDPQIKSVSDIVDGEKAKVISASQQSITEESLNRVVTEISANKHKSILILSPVRTGKALGFAESLAKHLLGYGINATYSDISDSWKTKKFENTNDIMIYACDGIEKGAVGYLSQNTDATCLVVDHVKVNKKQFVEIVNEVKGTYYGCIISNITKSYLG